MLMPPFEIIQIVMGIIIIIFSTMSVYYGIRTINIHVKLYGKLLSCCWLTVIKTIVHFLFGLVYFVLIVRIFFTDIIPIVPGTLSVLILEPIILLNSIINAIYAKRNFLRAINDKTREAFINGQ